MSDAADRRDHRRATPRPSASSFGEDPALASARDESGLPVVLLALFHQQREAADALLAAGPELGVLEAAARAGPTVCATC